MSTLTYMRPADESEAGFKFYVIIEIKKNVLIEYTHYRTFVKRLLSY